MEIKVLEEKDNKLKFITEGINTTFVNTLRRIMISEVPVLAIDEVNFLKNSSALYDEMIAHRLGLVPLKTDFKSYNLKEDCKCKGKGCSMCQLNINLKVKGPCAVYSSDLQSQDPEIKPIYDKILIVNLLKGQKLELEAVAILGKGNQHVKFSPGLVYYRQYPQIKIKNVANDKEVFNSCPKDVYELNDNKLKIKDLENCDLCLACVEASNDQIEIKGEENKFIFFIESWGQLKPKEILSKALDIFEQKLDDLNKALKKV